MYDSCALFFHTDLHTLVTCLLFSSKILVVFISQFLPSPMNQDPSGFKFNGKTVGIVGLDRIGSVIAKRAEALGCPICYYSRFANPSTNYKYYVNIVDLAADCQVLMVACSPTEETGHINNREVIDALGPMGVLVRVGLGSCVDNAELMSALLEDRLGGAGLDAYENEPEVPEELFRLDNVVLVPHAGSGTEETRKAMANSVLGNLDAHVLNKPLLTPVL